MHLMCSPLESKEKAHADNCGFIACSPTCGHFPTLLLFPDNGKPGGHINSPAGLVPRNALLVRRAGTGSRFSPRQRRPLPMAKSKRKRVPKTVLKLPDLEQSKSAVLNSLTSASSKRSYEHAIREFIEWYCSEPRLAFNRTVVTRDLRGKGGHIRTIPVPEWVKAAVDRWTLAASINAGRLLRSINKAGKIWGDGFTST